MKEWLKKIPLAAVKALIVRLVFAAHCFVLTYRVVVAYNNNLYWLLLTSLILLIVETVVTLIKRGGREWTWFTPAILCYLVTAVPAIWMLELQLADVRIQQAEGLGNAGNTTNQTGSLHNTNDTAFLSPIGVNISLDLAGWALAMEQALLFILILGRWFLPKGNISRNQLSQILLVYIGMAADIMELFEVFKEEQVAYSRLLIYPTLSLWTLALLQYTLVISATKAKKPRYGNTNSENGDDAVYNTGSCCKSTCGCDSVNIDVLGIMSTIVMQDGPFLCYRMYLLVGLRIISQMMVFFTCKNLLVLLLQIYRLIVIYFDVSDGDSDDTESSGRRGSDQSSEESKPSPLPRIDYAGGHGNGHAMDIQTSEIETHGRGRRNRVTPTPEKYSHPDSDPVRPGTNQSWADPVYGGENDLDHPHSVNSFTGIA